MTVGSVGSLQRTATPEPILYAVRFGALGPVHYSPRRCPAHEASDR